jgi:predicted transcriptional regulator
MDIYSKKYQLMEWIMNLRDTQMIDKLLSIAEKSDWWTEISQAERDSIERGMKDISENKVINHSDVMKQYEKYN